MALTPSGRIRVEVTGARGKSFADVARASGSFGANPQDNDAEVSRKFADYAIQQNPNFKGDTGPTGPANSTYTTLADLKNAAITNGSALLTAPGIGGTFLWVDGDFTGLADDQVFISSNRASVSEGVWVKQTSEAITTAAVAPGLGDNGPAIQALLNAAAGKTLLIVQRAVPYTVGASLKPASNTKVLIEAATEFVAVGSLKSNNGRNRGFFDAAGTRGVSITVKGQGEATFRAAPFNASLQRQPVDGRLFTVCCDSSPTHDLTVRDLMGRGVQHIIISSPVSYAEAVTPRANPAAHNSSTGIRVIRGGALNDEFPPIGGEVAAYFRYTFDFKVIGSSYKNVEHGVAWWGGNSALDADGMPQNERKCGNFKIADVDVDGSPGGGGIWGSMGIDGEIVNCRVYRCGDVGIDPEGCTNVFVRGCHAEDCGNANYSMFFACSNVWFLNCTSISKAEGATLFQTYNGTQTPYGQACGIQGGVWKSTAPNGNLPGRIAVSGAQRSITIQGVKAQNVVIVADGNNNNIVTIKDNHLTFDRFSGAAYTAIYVALPHVYGDGIGTTPATVTVTGNYIHTQAEQFATTTPIVVHTDDFNAAAIVEISNNDIRGEWRGPDIICRFRGTNIGTVPTYNVFNNRVRDGGGLGVGTIVNDSSFAVSPLILRRGGNRVMFGGNPSRDPVVSTGWQPDTGTSRKVANATYSATAEAAYTQATVQALMNAVRDQSQTIKAVKDALIAQGTIGE